MRHRTALIIALLLSAAPAWGQSEPPGAIGTPLAAARLDSVTGMPLFLRMYQVRMPAGGHSTYEGSNALLYDLSGDLSLEVDGGGAAQHIEHGAGAFIGAGRAVTLRAPASASADLLLILLTARPNQRRPVLDMPAAARELFRTPEPLPGLQDGPYEFSLEQLTLPSGADGGVAYSRSGVALDYVLAGTATVTTGGTTETTAAEMPLFEAAGWVHRLANAEHEPLVLLQANLSRVGTPAVRRAANR